MEDSSDSVDTEDYFYPWQFDLDGYTEIMSGYNEDSDDFYGILGDAMDYEDPVDKTNLIDN